MLAILGHQVDRRGWLARRLRRLRSGSGWKRYARVIARNPLARRRRSPAPSSSRSPLPALWLRIGLPVGELVPHRHRLGPRARRAAGHGARRRAAAAPGGRGDDRRQPGAGPRPAARPADPRRLAPRQPARGRRCAASWTCGPASRCGSTIELYGDTGEGPRSGCRTSSAPTSAATGWPPCMDVVLRDTVSLDGSLEAVREVRAHRRARPADAEARPASWSAGSPRRTSTSVTACWAWFPLLVVLVLGVTAVMLALVFKSVLVPIKAVRDELAVGRRGVRADGGRLPVGDRRVADRARRARPRPSSSSARCSSSPSCSASRWTTRCSSCRASRRSSTRPHDNDEATVNGLIGDGRDDHQRRR